MKVAASYIYSIKVHSDFELQMDETSKKEALSHKQWLTWIHSWWGCTEIKIMWTPFMMNTYNNAASELEFSSLQLKWSHNAKPKWHNQRETTKVHETKSKWKSKAETKWSNPEQNSQHVFWVKQKMFCWKIRQNQYRSTKEFSFNKSVFVSKMQNLCFKNSTTSVNEAHQVQFWYRCVRQKLYTFWLVHFWSATYSTDAVV